MPATGPGPQPSPDATACSVRHDAAATPAPGTAPSATFFLALEQDGPWGRVAPVESHLDPALGARLEQECSRAGGRFTLIRRPGRHPSLAAARRHVLLAWAGAQPWLLSGETGDPAALLGLDLTALATGDRARVLSGAPWLGPADPTLLVCTNGRRDPCCALRGRPIALAAGRAHPGRVWESSHTGGHRFAPTAVLLPHGRYVGRLDLDLATDLLDAAGSDRLPPALLGPRHDRGAARLSPAEQIAEAAVRESLGELAYAALDVRALPPADPASPGAVRSRPDAGSERDTTVTVRHTDGRSWTVGVRAHPGPDLPESCGKPAVTTRTWTVV